MDPSPLRWRWVAKTTMHHSDEASIERQPNGRPQTVLRETGHREPHKRKGASKSDARRAAEGLRANLPFSNPLGTCWGRGVCVTAGTLPLEQCIRTKMLAALLT